MWTEAFGDGDIDYRALVARLVETGVKPHIVLEQAVEAKTPHTLDAVNAHKMSRQYAASVFAPLAT